VLVRIVWSQRKAAFIYPTRPTPRTAVLIPGFRSHGAIRVFPGGWSEDAERFQPQSIAARLPQLHALAGAVSLTHALIIMRRPGEPHLTESQRTSLWKGFRVPIFEQIVDQDGMLLAFECEAHDGLHIESTRFSRQDHGNQYVVYKHPCACGRVVPRLRSTHRPELQRPLAAYAR